MSAPQVAASVTEAGTSLDGIVLKFLDQTCKPLHLSDSSFSCHAGDMIRLPPAVPHGIFNRSGPT